MENIQTQLKKGTVYFGLITLVLTFLTEYKESFPPKYYPIVVAVITVLSILKRVFMPSDPPCPIDSIPPQDVVKPENVTISTDIPIGGTGPY